LIAGRAELIDVAAAVARQVVRLAPAAAGEARLNLQATAAPARLRAALSALGLQTLVARAGHPSFVKL
jgi:glutamate racemase